MADKVARLETRRQQHLLPPWKKTSDRLEVIVSGMGTTSRIRKGARLHYYIKEWITHLNLTDQQVADRMNLASRSSVWKLYNDQERLSPGKVARIADALGVDPKELLFPPNVPSLDALAEGASPEQRAQIVVDISRRLKAS